MLRKNFRWFIPTIVPPVLFVTAIDSAGEEAANASLGRVLFTLELFVLTLFLHRVLRPTGAVLGRYIELNASGWVNRLRYIWCLLAVILPLVFAVLSWLGFHYTALQLQSRIEQTLILTLVLVVANEILHRWLHVARRRVAVEDAKRRRAQAEADAETKQIGTGDAPATHLSPLTRRRSTCPRLRMFDRVQVLDLGSTGDTVIVGGVAGTVMRIRMRATTIIDWDRKELVIPNKIFITGDVNNWTLTDPLLRLTIDVGVSYSSDIYKVERLLLKVAKNNSTVLVDPASQVLFKQFGDSALNYELRVYIPNIEYYCAHPP